MIARLRGAVLEASEDRVILDVGGVGYEVHVGRHVTARAAEGSELSLRIIESVALYGGAVALYGFVDAEEKALFECVKEHVPNTGAKKALEILEKAARSPAEFRRAVGARDAKALSDIFGFTKKTAEKLIEALKDKLPGGPSAPGAPSPSRLPAFGGTLAQALQALGSLGYTGSEARDALEGVKTELDGREAPVEELIRRALKKL